jgi:hypothetical protein
MLDPDKVAVDIAGIQREYKKFIADDVDIPPNFMGIMTVKYPYLAENAKILFKKCCTEVIEQDKVDYMLAMMRKIASKQQSEYDVNVEVGQKFVDEYIIPHIKK